MYENKAGGNGIKSCLAKKKAKMNSKILNSYQVLPIDTKTIRYTRLYKSFKASSYILKWLIILIRYSVYIIYTISYMWRIDDK